MVTLEQHMDEHSRHILRDGKRIGYLQYLTIAETRYVVSQYERIWREQRERDNKLKQLLKEKDNVQP